MPSIPVAAWTNVHNICAAVFPVLEKLPIRLAFTRYHLPLIPTLHLTENNSEYVILNSAIIEAQAPGFSYGKNRKIVPSSRCARRKASLFQAPGCLPWGQFRMTYSE